MHIFDAACIRVIQNSPFYASLLMQIHKVEDNKVVETCGVCMVNGKIYMAWDRKFIESLPPEQVKSIVEHELLHLCFGHILRGKFKGKERFNVACVPGNTFILGANKTIKDIKPSDKVMSQSGEFVQIQNVMSRKCRSKLYQIKASSLLPAEFTDDHPLLICRKHLSKSYRPHRPIVLNKPEWVTTKEVRRGDYVLIPKLHLKKYKALDLLPFMQEVNRFGGQPNNIKPAIRSGQLKLTADLAWVLGFYTAEGSLNCKSGSSGIKFTIHPVKDLKNKQKVVKYFQKLGYKASVYPPSRLPSPPFKLEADTIRIVSSIFGRAFSTWCGRGAHNKKIPDFILFNTDKNIRQAFILGYEVGDGCVSREVISSGTVSATLAYELQLLIMSLGDNHWANVSYRENVGISSTNLFTIVHSHVKEKIRMLRPGKEIRSHNWRWQDLGNYFAVPVISIGIRNYDGQVYNLSTKSCSSFRYLLYCRRYR